jgi:hypothetical protein
MDKERNLGVTEARFALTLLTCLLVAIGYVALLRLGGTKDASADVSAEDTPSAPSIVIPAMPSTAKVEPEPRVLPLEKPRDERNELAERPASSQQSPEPERR